MSAHIDPEWAEELHEAEREALQEMRALLKSDDAKLRFKAAEAIFTFADRCRRHEDRAAKAAQAEAPAPAAPEPPAAPKAEAVEKAEARKVRPRPKFDEAAFERLQRLREVTGQTPPFRAVPPGAAEALRADPGS